MNGILTAEEVADYLKMSVDHVRHMTSRRDIPFMKIGRLVRYSQNEIDAWLFRKTVRENAKKRVAAVFIFMMLLTSQAFAAIDIPVLTEKIVKAESSGNPYAIGDGGKARGLMQIQRATWERHTTAPWSKAFDPKLNRLVGQKEIRRIIRVYRARGIEPTAAHVAWTYNTGSFIKNELPAKKAGKAHPWTTGHPNRVYRAIYLQHFKEAK